MKAQPMMEFRTLTAARVLPPQPPSKPPAYATRLQQHIAMGRTPEEAMRLIERADGHRGSVPPTMPPTNCGGRGVPRPKRDKPLTVRILEALTTQWQPVNDGFADSVGASRNSVNEVLRKMREAGRVEYLYAAGKKKSVWRLPE